MTAFQAINSGFCKCERALNASVLCIYVYVCVHKSMSACESCFCECVFVCVSDCVCVCVCACLNRVTLTGPTQAFLSLFPSEC